MSFETRHPTLMAALGIAVVLVWALLFALYQRHRYPTGGAPLAGDGIDVLSGPDRIRTPYRLFEPPANAPSPVDGSATSAHGGRVIRLGERELEVVMARDGGVTLWMVQGTLPSWAILQFADVGKGQLAYDDIALMPDGDHLSGRGQALAKTAAAVLVVGDGQIAHSTPKFDLLPN